MFVLISECLVLRGTRRGRRPLAAGAGGAAAGAGGAAAGGTMSRGGLPAEAGRQQMQVTRPSISTRLLYEQQRRLQWS